MRIRIATRKSALALWQADHVAARLLELPEVDGVTLVPLSTRGDEILDRSLQKIGGKGLFIKELEVAMQKGVADIAVHSMKDVPAEMPDGFCIAALLQRANHADALVTPNGMLFRDLPEGALVGSSSLRRQAQLRMMRSDLRVEPLRGNVNTRLAKLENGDYDAIILAAAGLERLELDRHISQQFLPSEMLPAAAQGVVGIECLSDKSELRATLRQLNHATTEQTTLAERAIAKTLQADCQSPVATFAVVDGAQLNVSALVALPDGSRSIRDSVTGNPKDAEQLGKKLAARLLENGARELLDAASASMVEAPLKGVGVLVTRPRAQSIELVTAIEEAGGSAYCFPVMEIRALDENVVSAKAAELGEPDIVIFVSRNAVEYGMQYTNDARVCVIGPATAAAVEAAGHIVDIQPAKGFDSEHLLAEPELQDVAGKHVRIIRGNDGRELLAEALTTRGAIVEYLSVYDRRLPDVSAQMLADIESRWREGEISIVTVMSVQSLQNLHDLLPRWCKSQLESTPLVTPAARVLKEALDRYPASRPILASGPQASEMVAAIIALHKTEPGLEQ